MKALQIEVPAWGKPLHVKIGQYPAWVLNSWNCRKDGEEQLMLMKLFGPHKPNLKAACQFVANSGGMFMLLSFMLSLFVMKPCFELKTDI